MLWSSLDRKLRQIPRAAKGTPGGRPVSGAQAEQSLKRGHRVHRRLWRKTNSSR